MRSNAQGWSVPLSLNPSRALPAPLTHEQYVAAVRDAAAVRAGDRAVAGAKLVYGVGPGGVRGVTYYKAWTNGAPEPGCFMEVCASGEESPLQLAGTTIHECAHVRAGMGTGHGPEWKSAAADLGLLNAEAAGQVYARAHFAPDILRALDYIPHPVDGRPAFGVQGARGFGLPPRGTRGGCRAGWGSRGGTSRGTGAGSRSVKVECPDCDYKVRLARTWLDNAEYGAPECPKHRKRLVEG